MSWRESPLLELQIALGPMSIGIGQVVDHHGQLAAI
jgi:hypothetical protein